MCGLAAIHGGQLLSFACPKESNQRKRHPRIRALAEGEGSLRADGFRPQVIHGLLSKSARSIAPPACGARGFSVHPPPLLRGEERRAKTDVSHISGASAAGTAALCSSGSPLGRGKDSEEKPRSGGRQDAGHFDESTWMCSRRSPPSSCVVCRAGMPGKPRPRGCPFLGLLSFGQAKESNWSPWMATKPHTDVSRLSQQPTSNVEPTCPHPTLSRKRERGKANLNAASSSPESSTSCQDSARNAARADYWRRQSP